MLIFHVQKNWKKEIYGYCFNYISLGKNKSFIDFQNDSAKDIKLAIEKVLNLEHVKDTQPEWQQIRVNYPTCML